ncbi:MAG: sec-C metal-binding protein [Gemmatimonadetes bacterium]|nr:sec-C metal-binding protein [Gemmatimonadota bacterium]
MTPPRAVLTRLPSEVTLEVRQACARLGLVDEPRFVDIRPDPSAVINKCIFNVLAAVSAGRGSLVLGWKTHVWPRVLVEFVGHAVLAVDDVLMCITPDRYGETMVLFVPDARIAFDPNDSTARMPSQLVACSDHEDIAAFIRTRQEMDAIRKAYPPGAGDLLLTGAEAERFRKLERAQRRALRDISLRTLDHNAPCVCGRAKAFKKCCRPGMLRERDAKRTT